MRTKLSDQPLPPPRVLHEIIERQTRKSNNDVSDINDIEARWMNIREKHVPNKVLTLPEIEERLAALRGCDVELIRRPRCIFESTDKVRLSGKTVQELMLEAKDLADINDRYNSANDLEERLKSLRDEKKQSSNSSEKHAITTLNEVENDTESQRLSNVSTVTSFSEVTAKELEDLNMLMDDAQKQVRAIQDDDKRIADEMKTLLVATRQKSFEMEKVNREFGQFWNQQMDKISVDISDSDDNSLDDETVKKIILEAEQAIEENPMDRASRSAQDAPVVQSVPKKPGLLSKIFRR
ncbi:hypothetical protein DICVIV_10114 [Dictyocaulus viviparus]|uniref:Uncharacterized protein n=1 Tax=Dictyocaulus viviparus TaxID=29172 RepID=A0A0D8XJD8_DICVI|nr:hypothetical protein DICVIV_10114 [Dictyocaulus viviparus]